MSEKQVKKTSNSHKIYMALSIFWPVLFCLTSLYNQNMDKERAQSDRESHELMTEFIF